MDTTTKIPGNFNPSIDLMNEQLKEANQIPRRSEMWRWTTQELEIFETIESVEKMGADRLLTDAIILLQQAKDKISDYVDKSGLVYPSAKHYKKWCRSHGINPFKNKE